jgi:hypothetical protein
LSWIEGFHASSSCAREMSGRRWRESRQWQVNDVRWQAGQVDYRLGQLPDGELGRIADVDRARHLVRTVHQADQSADEIVDVAERARLRSVATNREIAAE